MSKASAFVASAEEPGKAIVEYKSARPDRYQTEVNRDVTLIRNDPSITSFVNEHPQANQASGKESPSRAPCKSLPNRQCGDDQQGPGLRAN